MGLAGCRAGGTALDAGAIEALAALAYPERARPAEPDPDVLVIRDGEFVRVINRTADAFRGTQLWLNQQYVATPEVLPPGETRLALDTFVNRYREAYPTGTLLTPDADAELLIAEAYDPATDRVSRFVVQPTEPERLPF